MKKSFGRFAALVFAVASVFTLSGCGYNEMVTLREGVDSQWANVENQYQRRNDLIPNLVSTVKGYASHEEKVYAEVAEARSKAGGIVNIDSSITDDPEKLAEFEKVQSQVGSSLQHLIAVSESYPELKANENFQDLQSQLEGTENRISTERKRYNDAVQAYNTAISKFPGVITAKMFGFKSKAYFKAAEGASVAPVVAF